nr:hypothetical protein B0A51_09325 [Rachicladosporium sp. CCFEE 5018]
MAWLGDDPWDRPRRPQAHHQHSGGHLQPRDPHQRVSGGIYRTRSQGHAPQPIVNVYNNVIQDANLRADFVYPLSPDFRGRRLSDRLGDEMLADELAELRLDRRLRSRSRTSAGRSHSRGRSGSGSSDFYKREYERLEREKQWKRDQARIEAEAELKAREAADKAKLDEQRLIDKMERDKKERKAEEQRIKDKLEREEHEAKELEKKQWEEFERKQLEKKAKKEKEEKEEQARIDEAMRKRLIEAGLSGRQIEEIMDKEKKKGKTTTTTTTIRTNNALTLHGGHQPVYAKIHRDYLSVETLRYYSIPYEYDPSDENYIIVLREMDKYETNILFDHTKALRAGRLLIEAPKNEKAYAFYRKRDRSKSRNRNDGEWKKFGILEYKK